MFYLLLIFAHHTTKNLNVISGYQNPLHITAFSRETEVLVHFLGSKK